MNFNESLNRKVESKDNMWKPAPILGADITGSAKPQQQQYQPLTQNRFGGGSDNFVLPGAFSNPQNNAQPSYVAPPAQPAAGSLPDFVN